MRLSLQIVGLTIGGRGPNLLSLWGPVDPTQTPNIQKPLTVDEQVESLLCLHPVYPG